jgi:hypothetical protein
MLDYIMSPSTEITQKDAREEREVSKKKIRTTPRRSERQKAKRAA